MQEKYANKYPKRHAEEERFFVTQVVVKDFRHLSLSVKSAIKKLSRGGYCTMPYKDPEVRKAKHKEYSRKHYENNKDKIVKSNYFRKKAGRIAFDEYKATLKCIKCGEDHPATLDFHHHTPHPDNKKIHELITNGQYTLAMSEIAEKCWVLCSNCHRRFHDWERKQKKLK